MDASGYQEKPESDQTDSNSIDQTRNEQGRQEQRAAPIAGEHAHDEQGNDDDHSYHDRYDKKQRQIRRCTESMSGQKG